MSNFQWHEETQRQWNAMSDNWAQNSQMMWEEGSRKTIIPLFSKFFSQNQSKVLDAGCGDGYGSWKLASLGYEVIGVDIAGEMVSKAKEKAKERITSDLVLSFQQGDLTQLPFPDQSFGAVLSVNALEWTSSPLHALKELKRVLQPEGIVCLGVLGPTAAPRQHSYQRLYGKEVICNTMMPWECEKLLGEIGFSIIHQEGVYKQGVTADMTERLSRELCQALSFMWLFVGKNTSSW
ncbi:class I SAM-dependent methyltransferase [Microaerobacter geothermalis]|uniref:class I SAM-dependent methyltransferase n=1 Tax=Microaerobacter geothermalis TaxID=674972 RepID=UPI001F1804F9|nr:class I SAM-dependent methyltransferase [Microaerobacter geothermalis]MCF6093654.1 class I SAM-dependent methyltransferase [Microaerobacter geothermalis]